MFIETRTSNSAQSEFPEREYAAIREVVLNARVPKEYASKGLILTPYNAEPF